MKYTILNMTGEDITIVSPDQTEHRMISVGNIVIKEAIKFGGTLGNIPILTKEWECKLPPQTPGILYIVSLPVARAIDREDFVCVEDPIFDQKNNVKYRTFTKIRRDW